MVVIDPSRDGCTVWYAGSVQFIHGTPEECAKRIIKSFTDDEERQFYTDIYLDTMGIGCAYADFFKCNNFKFHKVKKGNLIK